jgi:hypothetical protein
MSQLFMLNPSKRRRRKARKNPSRRRLTAKQRKYFGPRKARARINPSRRRRRARRNPILAANPRRRHRRMRRNPARRHYRRNPSLRLSARGIVNQVTDAATGAAGATIVDVLMGYIAPNLPASMLSPNVYPIVKGGVAIAFGAVGGMVGGTVGRFAAKGAEGSLIVTLHDVMRSFLPATLALGYINSGYVAPRSNMGAYVRGVRTPLMGVRTPLMGLGDGGDIGSAMEREMNLYGPGYQALSAYVR